MADAASSVLLAALAGPELSAAELAFFQEETPSGLTLFKRNVPHDIHVLQKFLQRFQSLRRPGQPPFIIAVDQEGGRVSRLKGHVPDEGPAMSLAGGQTDEAALAAITSYGQALADRLLELGINCNFAPVLDVLTVPANTAIGDRAFGTDLATVKLRAAAFFRGLQGRGLIPCLKHFPGQGAAPADTHFGSARIALPLAELMGRDAAAFAELLPHAPMVMISHCIYPSLDDQEASLSQKVITDLLQKNLQFKGVVVSDDMLMEAIPQDEKLWQEKLVSAVAAGVDLLLICKGLDKAKLALQALRTAAKRSPAFNTRLESAAAKVVHLRMTLPD